ncbi:unnamed protein product, partial [Dibothriocephalus latus]
MKLGDADVPLKQFKQEKKGFQKVMLRLSDEQGSLVLTKVDSGKTDRDGINPDDVIFIEDVNILYVIVGSGASEKERHNSWVEAE